LCVYVIVLLPNLNNTNDMEGMIHTIGLLAHYLQARFSIKLRASCIDHPEARLPLANPSLSLPLPLLYECERITDTLVMAMNNICQFFTTYFPPNY